MISLLGEITLKKVFKFPMRYTAPKMLAQFPLFISIEKDCLKNEVDLLSFALFSISFQLL